MKQYQLLCFLLPVCVCVCCTSPRYIHGPTALNTPYFQQKNDSKIGGFYSDNGAGTDTSYVHGYDLTAAYAVSDHVAITTSYHHRRDQDFYAGYPKDPFDTSLVRYKRSSWEAGGGYFLSLDDGKVSNFGIYGGIGLENFSIRESGRKDTADYSRHLDMKPFKFYVAPCYYFVTAPVRFALMFRLSWIRYNDLQSNYTSTEAEAFHLNNLSGRTLTVGEFGFDMQFRYPKFPWVALEGQASFSGTPTYFHARTFNVSGGLVIEPYRLLQKK